MSAAAWVGIVAGAVAVLGALAASIRFFVQSAFNIKIAALNIQIAELKSGKADVEHNLSREREHLAELDARHQDLARDFTNLKLAKTGVLLKHEIDMDVRETMEALGITEGSVLVPGPTRDSRSFVFLALHGPAAADLRKAKLPISEGIVGHVFKNGKLYNTANAQDDPNFFRGIDKKATHETRAMLTLPLYHDGSVIGVLQLLNKPGGFSKSDEANAEALARPLAAKVSAFASDPENFGLLGLAWQSEDEEATIVFCDLTSSSSLLRQMSVPSAIDCFNEYLEQQSDIAMRFGATVDKYTGDGVMLRFNVPRPILSADHVVTAVEAALDMRAAYERLKEGWIAARLPVSHIFSRIGISCGVVYEATIGHPQFQQITVIGEAVNEAANLCEIGSRKQNVILVNERVHRRLPKSFEAEANQTGGDDPPTYEILARPA